MSDAEPNMFLKCLKDAGITPRNPADALLMTLMGSVAALCDEDSEPYQHLAEVFHNWLEYAGYVAKEGGEANGEVVGVGGEGDET